MKVLLVVPDSNTMDKVCWLAQYNPDIKWDVVGVAPDCRDEPTEWADSFQCLNCDWKETRSYPQDWGDDDIALGGDNHFAYEQACSDIRSPLLGHWFHYHKYDLLKGRADLDNYVRPKDDYDVLATWGERGWYNETVIEIAKKRGKPVCRLERATFPGMYVVDGTGLEQGRCDLQHFWDGNSFAREMWEKFDGRKCPSLSLQHWLSVAPWQNIESQPRTTVGMARKWTDDRPSVFVPLQVPVDTNMIFRASGVCSNHQLLEYVVKNYQGYNVIVKKHPGDGFTSIEALQEYCDDRGFRLVNGATHAILQVVDEVVSINSQVIIEAWMHGLEPEILGQPAFDLPDEIDKRALLYTLRFYYYIEPWQFTNRLRWLHDK